MSLAFRCEPNPNLDTMTSVLPRRRTGISPFGILSFDLDAQPARDSAAAPALMKKYRLSISFPHEAFYV